METTQTERDEVRRSTDENMRREFNIVPVPRELVGRIVNDADRLAVLERAVIVREDVEPPMWAEMWCKGEKGCFWFRYCYGEVSSEQAPDLRPDIEGPVTLPVVSLREGE